MVTGAAGFIGSNLVDDLLLQGHEVFGLDNFDPFYNREIKLLNLKEASINSRFHLLEIDITQKDALSTLPQNIDIVIHLAAKAGVRPSILYPTAYINSNIIGTLNILEWMRQSKIKKMIFASSSSVYGNNKKSPFSESDPVDNPISPYAFTKKAGELLNYNYHHLYSFDIINLRFFTVYGERQRPDLAIHKFVRAIFSDEPIQMFGSGNSARDYTYIGDIISGIRSSMNLLISNNNIYEIINLGNSTPLKLKELISMIGRLAGRNPTIENLPLQDGDVELTYADITKARRMLHYTPHITMDKGLEKFISWYLSWR